MTFPPNLDADSEAGDVGSEDEGKKRMPLVWIPATLSVGLLIAAIYLGGRILTAHSPVPAPVEIPPPAPVVAAPIAIAPAPLPPKAEVPKLAEAPQDPPRLPLMIAPRPGEQYIQISALTQEAADRYVQQLRRAKLEPHLAPGPRPQLVRVLIGPFSDQDALAHAKTELEADGIETFVRKY